jgi:hypothetical protein
MVSTCPYMNIIKLTSLLVRRNGETVEYRRDPIARSDYHARLDSDVVDGSKDDTEDIRVAEPKVRYWSDYSRVFFHHRSINRLPDLPDWEDTEGDWVAGAELFQKYDEVYCFLSGVRPSPA